MYRKMTSCASLAELQHSVGAGALVSMGIDGLGVVTAKFWRINREDDSCQKFILEGELVGVEGLGAFELTFSPTDLRWCFVRIENDTELIQESPEANHQMALSMPG